MDSAEDLKSYKDLSEHFSNSLAVVEHYNVLRKERNNLEGIFKKLNSDVENLRASEKNLTRQLQTISKTREDEESITKLYTKLKDCYSDLEKKFNQSLRDNVVLQEKCLFEVNELKAVHQREQNALVQDLTLKIKTAEVQLHDATNNFLKKESELYNELQLVQASNALQYDEMEAKLQSLHLELRDSNDSHNSLRQEYLHLKTQSKCDVEAANKSIVELERKLRLTEQQLRMNQEQLFNYDARCAATDLRIPNQSVTANTPIPSIVTNRPTISVSETYNALDTAHSARNVSLEKSEACVNTVQPVIANTSKASIVTNRPTYSHSSEKYSALNTVHSSRSVSVEKSEACVSPRDVANIHVTNLKNVISKFKLPALIQPSKSVSKPTTGKKRKLWNP